MRIDNIVCSAGLRRCLPETCGLFFVNPKKPQVPAKPGRGHMLRVAIFALTAMLASAAEPDWDQMNRSAVDLLQQYIRIESINPPANTAEAANFFKRILEDNGIPAQLYPSGPNGQTNLVARIAGRDRSKKPLLLMNHFDVVPVDRKAWEMDPFAAVIQNGNGILGVAATRTNSRDCEQSITCKTSGSHPGVARTIQTGRPTGLRCRPVAWRQTLPRTTGWRPTTPVTDSRLPAPT